MSQRDLSDYDKEESDEGLYGEPRGYGEPRLRDDPDFDEEASDRIIIMRAAKMLGVEPDELTVQEASRIIQGNTLRNTDIRIRKAGEDLRNRGA